MNKSMKISIIPDFDHPEKGEGGIRRVVEAQKKHLPGHGIEVIGGSLEERLEKADMMIYHGGIWHPTNKPTISHSHGLYWKEFEWPNWAHEINQLVVNAMRQATVVTSPSKWVARIIERSTLLKSPVLYHGIDPEDWPLGVESAEKYVLWNKNRVDPICENDSLDRLAAMADDTSFISTFATRNHRPNITVTGRLALDSMRSYVSRASVYLCTTRETFGIGTIEAMASGVPVLGWRWGGQREIVDHGVNGYLATPGDFDDLHAGLKACMENKEKWGRAGRQKVLKEFTWSKIMQDYAKLYKETFLEWQEKQKGPRVSVVITCYNLASSLPRAVQSVSVQTGTGQDHEIIIVNDASPDNTKEVAAKLAAENPKIRVVENEKNLYLAGSLNAGIRASRGRYILPLDADNEIAPYALQVLGDALDNPNYSGTGNRIDIAYGAMGVVEPNGKKFVSEWPPAKFDYSRQLSHRNQITSTALFRREIWERVGGHRRRCRTGEDADFWCRATSFGAVPAKVTDAPVLVYYNREDSMSHVERDWPWEAWYPNWSNPDLAPALAPIERKVIPIPTYEPPRVTVIIPVGPGHGELLVDALDSLMAQDFERWDCIVVNDSGEPLSYVPPFVKVITTKGGRGPAHARNLGVKASTTPLFMFLDADDYLQPNALSAMLRAWEPGYYVYTDWVKQESGEIYQTPEWNCQELLQKQPHSIVILAAKEAWAAAGKFDEKIEAWEDWDFLIALAASGTCGKRVPAALFHYRLEAGARREAMYARQAELKKVIADKWSEYISGGKQLMACGACGKKDSPVHNQYQHPMQSMSATQSQATVLSDSSKNALVQLEFTGEAAPRTYRGAEGRTYRFGSDPTHKVKYVFAEDAKKLLELPDFRIYDSGTGTVSVEQKQLLQAAGPPKRS